MHRMTAGIIVSIVLFAAPAASAGDATSSDAIDRLEAVADRFPPQVTPQNREEIVRLWKSVELGLLRYRHDQRKPDFNAELMLGEIYRLGHNLDVEDASDKAIAHFKAALAIDPSSSKAHMLLGRHLTYINELKEGQHELLLAIALDPRGAGDARLFDMAQNCYLQKQFALAASFADRYLAIHPLDPAMTAIAAASKKVLAGGTPPKVMTIEVP
jgi:tetratricopeptide (TPR) repeat protein